LRTRHRQRCSTKNRKYFTTANLARSHKLVAGMIFTIEPMINAGKRDIKEMGDGWTIVTKDHSLSAQWEHTVLVTETGYEVLTVSAGTPCRARLS
jgi:methionine aminopeptidase